MENPVTEQGTEPRFRARDDVRFRLIADEAVVIRQRVAEVIVLNEVGGRILELLAGSDSGLTRAELVSALVEEYDVDSETLHRDVEEFLAELRDLEVAAEES